MSTSDTISPRSSPCKRPFPSDNEETDSNYSDDDVIISNFQRPRLQNDAPEIVDLRTPHTQDIIDLDDDEAYARLLQEQELALAQSNSYFEEAVEEEHELHGNGEEDYNVISSAGSTSEDEQQEYNYEEVQEMPQFIAFHQPLNHSNLLMMIRSRISLDHPLHQLFVRQQQTDIDMSYEGLLRLSELIGEVKPRGLSIDHLNSFPFTIFSADSGKDHQCVVCLCDFEGGEEIVGLVCDHWFHRKCAIDWLAVQASCPVCRIAVPPPPTTISLL